MTHRLSLTALLLSVAGASLAAGPHQGQISVDIVALNDFHGHVASERFVTVDGQRRPAGGAASIAGIIRGIRAAQPNTLVVNSGDMIGASPLVSALFQDEPTIEFMNLAGFDVGALGNHDLDEGVAEAKRLYNGGVHPASRYAPKPFPGARFPVVCANLLDAETGRPIFPPYVVRNSGGVRIGFIGAVTSELPTVVTADALKGTRLLPPVEAINRWAAHLKKHGVRTIIALVHEGGSQSPEREGGTLSGPIRDIADQVHPEVDVIVAAHSHRYHNAFVGRTLVTQARSYGDAYARISLTIDRGSADVVRKSARIEPTLREGVTEAADVKRMVDGYAALAAPRVSRVVGRLDADLPARGKPGDSPLGNYIADAQRAVTRADIAFMNPGGVRASLSAGDVTFGAVYSVQPFGNTLTVLTMTGRQVRQALEQQWPSGGDERSTILFVSGLRYTFDPNGVEGARLKELKLDSSAPLDDAAKYRVAVNSFLAGGGDGFSAFASVTEREAGPLDIDALVAYMKTARAVPASGRVTAVR